MNRHQFLSCFTELLLWNCFDKCNSSVCLEDLQEDIILFNNYSLPKGNLLYVDIHTLTFPRETTVD